MSKLVKKQVDKQQISVAWRFYVVVGLIVFVYAGLLARSAYIQIIEPDMLKKQGDMRSLRTAAHTVQRGSIVDRNGRELAISVPVETVWADPKIIMDNNALAMKEHWQALADVLGRNVNKLTSRIVKNPTKRFVYVERKVSPAMAKYIKELKIPGIHLRKESKRFYPSGEISAHVVGFTNVDDKGIEGVERVYDQLLTGTDGEKQYRKDAKGRKIEILSEQESTQPKDIVLSIDQRIQAIAYKELKGAVKAFKATSGSVVVTNVHTGEILALVNSPSYNPNNRRNTAIHRFRNRAITDFYEPGSTLKPLTALTALEFGSVKADSIIDTSPGWMRLGGRRVGDPINRGKLSITDILVHSSNMGTTKLALSVPKEFLLNKFFDAGFGEETGVGLVGESSGIMHDRQRWSKFELATLSWGHGVAATPLQLARFYSTLANGGIKKPLTIIKKDTLDTIPLRDVRIFSEQSSEQVVGMLENVVNEHTPNAKVEGYRVGGKTGTAIKAFAGGYGNEYVGLFAGMAPISDPEIVVVVVINEPGGDLYHGGEVAAPVFSRVMKGALRVLNIAPDAKRVADIRPVVSEDKPTMKVKQEHADA
ncbi:MULTISPECIES: penicillin-binding protein 2 [unclassified Colwellia]|jgi:cell division protein FtsI (penicillin-binding protein 3)|uniref:peptidoglycan D,D-transpeptidase FtsI family protein n=1 Tax=unclassified Colwellia TaxID=196834 RepID=UPI0015F3B0B8|nr:MULTISPECIES: penicillin-binding transpeptidase domain-containing protein [unclassified Colwellia]MBA6335900.1 peptidoglycan glycosyltransferase FtsI [Colwellia sp. BRX8-7]MBA6354342.1 peptidoglycan glycosyltransferase FtsI [Colwellia sp. BRX8-3]MBA6358391.1 peptidoglycan glycosyltransferase FtsI [Colwellia sp. BRX8-6]MBA6367907.1 peptidoglycan glycosyltransferase FtsI [Colwellia sp. BRX8-5]MBA6370234.1 peptidoglycan glycosyltransferase FtsI [Colwellia sp. BRX8-4]